MNRISYPSTFIVGIQATHSERWKLLQVLPVAGQNDGRVEDLLISKTTFNDFVDRHQRLLLNISIVPESTEAMTSSYLMVDPAGRIYDNTKGKILTVGKSWRWVLMQPQKIFVLIWISFWSVGEVMGGGGKMMAYQREGHHF